jgi:hypothetical protein
MTRCPHDVPTSPPGRYLPRCPFALAGPLRCWSERRVWDSNPREHSRALTVFKTVALVH